MNQTPDHKTIADFRREHPKALQRVVRELIELCKALELFGGEIVAIDGSKFLAVNSAHRNYTERKLKKALQEIDKKLQQYLQLLDANDGTNPILTRLTSEQLQVKIDALQARQSKYQDLQTQKAIAIPIRQSENISTLHSRTTLREVLTGVRFFEMNSEQLELTIGWLYPTLMSTYGDRGNVICIQRRSEWRGYTVKVLPLDSNSTAADLHQVDLLVGGGAQDRQQEIVMRDLRGVKAEALREKIEGGTPGVFTCGAPQLLGHYYEPGVGQRIEGLGLFDFVSVHPGLNARRCIGNLVIEVTAKHLAKELEAMTGSLPYLIGFENHGGRTRLGQVEALGRVVQGLGNNGEDGTEGAFYRNAIATYSHGPLLPKNPFLADWLIQTALSQKYQNAISLKPLDDTLAMQAREAMFKRLHIKVPVKLGLR